MSETRDAVVNKTVQPPKKVKADKKVEIKNNVQEKEIALISNSVTPTPKNEVMPTANPTSVSKKSFNKNSLNPSKGTEANSNTRKVRFFLHFKNSLIFKFIYQTRLDRLQNEPYMTVTSNKKLLFIVIK